MYYVLSSNKHDHYSHKSDAQAFCFTKEYILEAAYAEISKTDFSFEDMAKLDLIEDADGEFHYEREMRSDELFELSVAKLGDEGRMFKVFPTDEQGKKDFLEMAEYYNVKEQAMSVVEEVQGEMGGNRPSA